MGVSTTTTGERTGSGGRSNLSTMIVSPFFIPADSRVDESGAVDVRGG